WLAGRGRQPSLRRPRRAARSGVTDITKGIGEPGDPASRSVASIVTAGVPAGPGSHGIFAAAIPGGPAGDGTDVPAARRIRGVTIGFNVSTGPRALGIAIGAIRPGRPASVAAAGVPAGPGSHGILGAAIPG